jgi:translation initiation factor IF-2
LKPPIVVRDLAEQLKKKPFQLIADLMEMGVFATVNQAVEPEFAQRVCAKYNFRFRVEKREKGGGLIHRPPPKKEPEDAEDRGEDLRTRPPVVTIMGHVDHGKTSLLDVIRKSNVVAGEAGGITQHIGAYTIAVSHPDRPKELCQITFLDTPGHAAFSAMRARGAHVTDVVVLVVAANDGVMPQTLEALSHAQAAKVPILVAVNKCDHPNANPLRVRQQLQERGLTPDDWGGETIFVDVSALTKQGIDKLLGGILLQAELLELKANPSRRAKGNVVESGLEAGGPTATVLVRKGTLRVGDLMICGQYYGKVRALIDEDGKRLKVAEPSRAVRVLGLNGVPEAGAEFDVVENEKAARALCEERATLSRDQETERRPKVTLENIFQTLQEEQAKVLRVVIKADTQGSVEAIADALRKIESDKVSLEIIYSGVGTVTKEDVLLASASKGIILGFHTRIDGSVPDLAKREGVQIKLYAIIYELIDQVKEAMAGLLDPLLKEVVFGVAEVRRVFTLSKGGHVAGCVVSSGRLVKGKARVMRRRNLIHEGIIQTLRRFQDEANEVRAGMECGIRLDGFDDFQEGDTIECYTIEKVAQKL